MEEIKVGSSVTLLKDYMGYKKGDVAKIIKMISKDLGVLEDNNTCDGSEIRVWVANNSLGLKPEVKLHSPQVNDYISQDNCTNIALVRATTPVKEIFPGIYTGDIVVSKSTFSSFRNIGEMFQVLPDSEPRSLKYGNTYSSDPSAWRKATELETANYRIGVRNIKDIKDISLENEDFISSKQKPLSNVKNKQVRSKTATIRQGERLCEDRLQGKKGSTAIAVSTFDYRGSYLRSNSKAGRLKGRISS